jgi:hypothetical protein
MIDILSIVFLKVRGYPMSVIFPVLGFLMGAVFVLTVQGIAAELRHRKAAKEAAFRQAVNDEITRREQSSWDAPLGWDFVEPTDSPRFQPIRHP